MPVAWAKHLLALRRPVNPSKPTNPTNGGRAICGRVVLLERRKLDWYARDGKTLARAWTVGKPFKAYKPHQRHEKIRP